MSEIIKSDIKKINIDGISIYLEDMEYGKGKIIITGYHNSYSAYWGAMGSTLLEFISRIDSDYFISNLTNNMFTFDGKQSVANVRKYIREEIRYELPWYKFMEGQRELREELKKLESCNSDKEFVYSLPNIVDNLLCIGMSWEDEKEFIQILKDSFQEPWHFIGEKKSGEYKFLKKLHGKLKNIN